MRMDYQARRFYLGRDYSEALKAAGAVPMHIPLIPDREYIAEAVGAVDGILLPGSDSDVDPFYYGEEPHPKLGKVVPEKDQTDRLVLEEVETRSMPLFAICYGMQALNVFRGGTIIQDIESSVGSPVKHQQGFPLERKSHTLTISEGCALEEALGVGVQTLKVNSHHHQAIARTGKNLEAVAVAADGVIEAIEDTRKDRFVLGVQWHPEMGWEKDPVSTALFELFVTEARNWKNEDRARAGHI